MPVIGLRQVLDDSHNPLTPLKSYLYQCKNICVRGVKPPNRRPLARPHVVGFEGTRFNPTGGTRLAARRRLEGGFFPPVKLMSKSTDGMDRGIYGSHKSAPSISQTFEIPTHLNLSPNSNMTQYYHPPVDPNPRPAAARLATQRTNNFLMTPSAPPATQPGMTTYRFYTDTTPINPVRYGKSAPAMEPRTYSNIIPGTASASLSQMEREGVSSYLPRANDFRSHTPPFFVRRHKIKSSKSLLTQIMTGDKRTATARSEPLLSKVASMMLTAENTLMNLHMDNEDNDNESLTNDIPEDTS